MQEVGGGMKVQVVGGWYSRPACKKRRGGMGGEAITVLVQEAVAR